MRGCGWRTRSVLGLREASESAWPAAAQPPVFWQVRMLEEDDVVVDPGFRDRIPHLLERLLEIVGFDRDLENTYLVGPADLGVRQRCPELVPGLHVARRSFMEHEHRDLVL